jgi:transposase
MCFTGSCNTQLFLYWIREFLLKELKPGQIVIMDNATFHKSKEVKLLIHSVGCTLIYLPPYSPDFNPIENFWAWMKLKIREISHLFTTIQEVVDYVFNMCHKYII